MEVLEEVNLEKAPKTFTTTLSRLSFDLEVQNSFYTSVSV
jgi:hypothetical protein